MARQERSAGIIVFIEQTPGRRYLLLDYGKHWDYPKGHLKKGETDQAAALRELHEETGISEVELVSGFFNEIKYFFRSPRGGLIQKTVVFFLGQIESDKVTLSHEHKGYAFLRYEDAINRLTYPNARQILRLAEEFLSKDEKS